MAPRKKGKRKLKNLCEKVKKNEKITTLLRDLDDFVNSCIKSINFEKENICQGIEEMYDLQLKGIPQQFHSMTFEQVDDFQYQTPPEQTSSKKSESVRLFMSKFKNIQEQRTLASNKKKWNPNPISLKSSERSDACIPYLSSRSSEALKYKMYDIHQANMSSPHWKGYASPVKKKNSAYQRTPFNTSTTITPKFDIKLPLSNYRIRKPKLGETIISLSGSPLQNSMIPVSEKPVLLLPLDDGKTVNIAENTELSHLDTLKLNHETKVTLASIQQKLSELLNI